VLNLSEVFVQYTYKAPVDESPITTSFYLLKTVIFMMIWHILKRSQSKS